MGETPLNGSTQRDPVVPATFVDEQFLLRFPGTAASYLARGSSLPDLIDQAYAAMEAETFFGRVSECFGGLWRGRRNERTGELTGAGAER